MKRILYPPDVSVASPTCVTFLRPFLSVKNKRSPGLTSFRDIFFPNLLCCSEVLGRLIPAALKLVHIRPLQSIPDRVRPPYLYLVPRYDRALEMTLSDAVTTSGAAEEECLELLQEVKIRTGKRKMSRSRVEIPLCIMLNL